eukprot:Amastigsp_a755_100.p3 type:complete len:111 gc:universal Amastigsp_a755_100:222-554(+)
MTCERSVGMWSMPVSGPNSLSATHRISRSAAPHAKPHMSAIHDFSFVVVHGCGRRMSTERSIHTGSNLRRSSMCITNGTPTGTTSCGFFFAQYSMSAVLLSPLYVYSRSM